MIQIKKYFTEADRKALYDTLANRKQDGKPLLVHLIQQGNKHTFNSSLYGSDVIKDKLLDFFHGKCGYCEDFMGNRRIKGKPDWDWEIEHYRPKANVLEDPLHGGYYWLAYECTNFLIVCSICNGFRRKGSKFPIATGAIRLTGVHFIENDNLKTEVCSILNPIFETEEPLLINPVIDKPKDFIEFFPDGTVKGKNERGEKSIEVYGLDRQTLSIMRKGIVDNIKKSIALVLEIAIESGHSVERAIKIAINRHINELVIETESPKTRFIAFRYAILNHFDSFIITNENGIGHNTKPFILPKREILLSVYWEIRNRR